MDTKKISISDYSYDLPDERIAKFPVSPRDHSRLLVYDKGDIIDRSESGWKRIIDIIINLAEDPN